MLRILLLLISLPAASPPIVAPGDAGMSAAKLAEIDGAVKGALEEKKLPGCVVCIGRRGKIVLLKAYGHRSLEPRKIEMTTDTVFDLASLTKPLATSIATFVLIDQKKLRLDDRVAKHIPEFAAQGKDQVTIEHLLLHTAGLIPDNPLSDYNDGPEKALARIWELKPVAPPGERFLYSDVSMMTMAEVVRRAAGEDIHKFSQRAIYRPLGMKETGYLPDESLRQRAAPNEKQGDQWLQGEVHDPRAAKLGGIAGHAGLFSTASELAILADMLLGRGARGETRILSEDAWKDMTRPREVPIRLSSGREATARRSPGWDIRSGFSSNRGRTFSDSAFGHGGFTGTSFWVDPEKDLFVIFLSNRLHVGGRANVNPLAGAIGRIAADAIEK